MASSVIPKTVEKWEQIGSAGASGNTTLWHNINDYKCIAWYLINNSTSALEGYFCVSVSVFKQYNSTSKSMGINAYNSGRQYAYLNYVSATTAGVQLSTGRSVAIWGIK